MAIRLDNFTQQESEKESLRQGYLYKDIDFDIVFQRSINEELYSEQQPKDLSEIQDGRAIVNSVKNILTTTPGQKLLNPLLGLDLRSYLFEPVAQSTSFFIASDIYENLGTQEPRILLQTVSVEGLPDEHQYDVEISYSIPTLEIYNLSLNATLNKDGYIVL